MSHVSHLGSVESDQDSHASVSVYTPQPRNLILSRVQNRVIKLYFLSFYNAGLMRGKKSLNRYAQIDGASEASFLNNSLAVLKNIMRDAGETLYFVRDAPRLTRGPESTNVGQV